MKNLLLLLFLLLTPSVLCAESYSKLLQKKSFRPGLCVVLGCDNAENLTAARNKGKYLVQGLSTNKKNLDSIRKELVSKSAYGNVSVSALSGNKLPYVDNLLNVLVVVDQGRISDKEIMRVIAPYGVAIYKEKSSWKKIFKPYPKEMDEWKQNKHDAASSSISKDALVAPPTRLRWLAQEKYDRENLVQLLSAGGRNFYLFNGGKVVARDAFNGTRLWELENAGAPWIATDKYLCTIIGIRLALINSANGELTKTDVKLTSACTWNQEIIYTANSAFDLKRKKFIWQNPEPKRSEGKPLIADGKMIFSTSRRYPKPEIICRDVKTGKDLWRISSLGTPSLCYRGKLLIKGLEKDETITVRNKKTSHT